MPFTTFWDQIEQSVRISFQPLGNEFVKVASDNGPLNSSQGDWHTTKLTIFHNLKLPSRFLVLNYFAMSDWNPHCAEPERLKWPNWLFASSARKVLSFFSVLFLFRHHAPCCQGYFLLPLHCSLNKSRRCNGNHVPKAPFLFSNFPVKTQNKQLQKKKTPRTKWVSSLTRKSLARQKAPNGVVLVSKCLTVNADLRPGCEESWPRGWSHRECAMPPEAQVVQWQPHRFKIGCLSFNSKVISDCLA